MTTNPGCIRLAPDRLVRDLQSEAMAAVEKADELELDLAAIQRVDTAAAQALEELAGAADRRGIRVRLRNTNLPVYKALLLLGLTRRFTFES
jgi:anti-anti-sigma regulatory factor